MPVTAANRELDWKTPLKSVDMGRHWRIWLAIVVFSACSTRVWHTIFPHTDGFLKLWSGLATGSLMGTLAGMFWQFRDRSRRSLTSGKFLLTTFLAWGTFAAVSLVMLAPQMHAEEMVRREMRSLTAQTVLSIEVKTQASRKVLNDRKTIDQFCKAASHAELFYPSHEGSVREYEISISLHDEQVRSFTARVPERHQNDLSLEFTGPSHCAELILPDGRKWMDSAMGPEEDSQHRGGG